MLCFVGIVDVSFVRIVDVSFVRIIDVSFVRIIDVCTYYCFVSIVVVFFEGGVH